MNKRFKTTDPTLRMIIGYAHNVCSYMSNELRNIAILITSVNPTLCIKLASKRKISRTCHKYLP